MKHLLKQVTVGAMTAALLVTSLPAGQANAATDTVKTGVPSKARVFTGGTRDVMFDLKDNLQVKSVKSSSKNLIVKLTGRNYRKENKEIKTNNYTITCYGKKDGKSTVTVKLSDGSSKKITVYTYPSPVSFKIDGKKNNYLSNTTKKSAKIKVSLVKGNTLKEVSYSVTKKNKNENGYDTQTFYKKFKNGDKIPLCNQPYYYSSSTKNDSESYSYESDYYNTNLFAYTSVQIKYKDKYTKQMEEQSFSVASKLVP